MATKLVLTAEAATEVTEAYGWYENRRRGLGEEFLTCVEASINNLVRFPDLHAVVYQRFRRALVRRFPYAVFYEFTGDTVVVFGVLHTAQDPEKLRQRRS